MINKKSLLISLCVLCGFLAFNPYVFCADKNKTDYSIGLDYMDLKEYTLAVKYFRQVITADPTNCDAHYNLGLAYKNLGMINEALAEFKKAFELTKTANKNASAKSEPNQPAPVKAKIELPKIDSQMQDYLDMADIYFDNHEPEFKFKVQHINLNKAYSIYLQRRLCDVQAFRFRRKS